MKRLIAAIFVCCLATAATAQKRAYVSQSASLNEQPPLVLVDSVETSLNDLWINPANIESMNVLKDSAAIAKYGDKGKNGVILIRTKTNTELIKLTDLITQYDVSIKDKNLKVCRDKILVENPDKILVDKKDILKIEVITDTWWQTPMIVGSEEKFINIVTKRK
jgi:TonB-dependent SusC/RagA subfamily outer membrane receptor